jgi:hypothetical protein
MENVIIANSLLSRQEAAAYLGGICLTTLSRLAIPQVKIRRRVFYRKADIEKWLARHVSKTEVTK